jgi:hypothetical protein
MGFFMRGGLGLAAFFALALWLYGCSTHGMEGTSVCGTEIEDPYQLAGCVEKNDGGIGIGVRVTAIPTYVGLAKTAFAETAPRMVGLGVTATTDGKGIYKFKGLPPGEYTLYFDYQDSSNPADVQAHKRNNVYALSGRLNPLDPTRLQPAVTLNGTVYNAMDKTEVEGAVCRIKNTPYEATTVENGSFLIYALPGKYEVICEKGELKSEPYEVTLEPGVVSPPRIPMTEGGMGVKIPLPNNATATWDTVSALVRVTWSKPAATSELFQYRVRRLELERPDLLIVWDGVMDTMQIDPVFGSDGDTITSKLVQYNVSIKRGVVYGNAVSTKPFLVQRGPTAKVGFLDSAKVSCVVGDTALLVAAYKSRYHHNSQVIWSFPGGSKENPLRDVKVDNRAGADTLAYPCIAPGNPILEIRVKDEAGITLITHFKFEIVPVP